MAERYSNTELGVLELMGIDPILRAKAHSRQQLHRFSVALLVTLLLFDVAVVILMPEGMALYANRPVEWCLIYLIALVSIHVANGRSIPIAQLCTLVMVVTIIKSWSMLPTSIRGELACQALNPTELQSGRTCLNAVVEAGQSTTVIRQTCATSPRVHHPHFDACPNILYHSTAVFWVIVTWTLQVIVWVFLPIMLYYLAAVQKRMMEQALAGKKSTTVYGD